MKYKKLCVPVVAVVAVSAIAVAAPVYATSSSADDNSNHQTVKKTISIPVSKVIDGESGKIYELATKSSVANGEYRVKVVATNQSSVHPNSDIIVRSGVSQVVVEDVEKEAFKSKDAKDVLNVIDESVTVYVQLGKDKKYSGGVEVVLEQVAPAAVEDESAKPEKVEKTEKTEDKSTQTPAPVAAAPSTPATTATPEATTLPEAGPAGVGALAFLSSVIGYLGHLSFRKIRG